MEMRRTIKEMWNDKMFKPVKYILILFVIVVIGGFIIWKVKHPEGTFF